MILTNVIINISQVLNSNWLSKKLFLVIIERQVLWSLQLGNDHKPRDTYLFRRAQPKEVYSSIWTYTWSWRENHDLLMNYYEANTLIITNWVMIINPKNLSKCVERNNKEERLVRNKLIMSNAWPCLVDSDGKLNLCDDHVSSITWNDR